VRALPRSVCGVKGHRLRRPQTTANSVNLRPQIPNFWQASAPRSRGRVGRAACAARHTPFIVAGVDLWSALIEDRPQSLYAWRDGSIERWGSEDLRRRTSRIAADLRARGVAPRSRVGCILTNTPEACCSVLAVWMLGGLVASLPIISRGMSLDEYRLGLRALSEEHAIGWVLAEDRFVPFLEPTVEVLAYEQLGRERDVPWDPPAAEDVAFVQFSSGSTRNPRGCALTVRAIEAQLGMLREAIELDPDRDRGVTWLPLSHDMGFFGSLLLFWSSGVNGLITPPERFLSSPRSWIDDCSRFEATLTVAPDAAIALVARAFRTGALPPAFPLRACIVGGERIHWSSLRAADEVLAGVGMSLDRFKPAYGLAEATLAVTMTPVGASPTYIDVPEWATQTESDQTVEAVSVGRPLTGVSVRPVDDQAGELLIRSPSLACGYLDDPTATESTFINGELHTGDIGFCTKSGELAILGRTDDVIKVGARKIWATEVEAAVARDPAVRSGNCVLLALPTESGERLVLLAERKSENDAPDSLARRLARATLADSGISVHECIFVPSGTLPKTPSGKIQRHRCLALAASARSDLIRVPLTRRVRHRPIAARPSRT
jgi:fatty-acyl-CoA synthase